MMRICSPPRLTCRSAGGFSIPELLVYVTLGALVAAGAAMSVITNIRTASNLELRQRAVDDFSRLNGFLQSEIAEAQQITYPPADSTALPQQCGPGSLLFTVRLDLDTSSSGPVSAEPISFYYTRNNGNDLWRCGVAFTNAGKMDLPTSPGTLPTYFDARVNSNTRLTPLNTSDRTASWALTYTMELRTNSGTVVLQRGSATAPLVARTSVRSIQ
jgi:hypothetical protein